MPTTVVRNYRLNYTNEPAWVDSFVTSLTEGPRATYEGGTGDDVYTWITPMKHGVAMDANRDIYVLGARWWRIRPEVLVNTGLNPVMYIGLENETIPISQETLVPNWVTTTGWHETHFDTPVLIPRGTRFCMWFSVTTGGPFSVSRDPGHFTDPTNSRLGLMTTVDPSGWFQFGDEFGYVAEWTPGDRFDTWYWIDPLVTRVAPEVAPVSFTDDFERADGGLGANWLDHVGGSYAAGTSIAATIVSGTARSPTGGIAVARRNLVIGGGGHTATMTVQFPANNGHVRLLTRMTDDLVASGAMLSLSRVDAGTVYLGAGLFDAGSDITYSGGPITMDATIAHTLRIDSNGIHQNYYLDDVLRYSMPEPGVDITAFDFGDYIGFTASGDSGAGSGQVLSISGGTL